MYHELVLVFFQLCGIPLNIYYKTNSIETLKTYISTLYIVCIAVPIIEEILFRYAFYHLLEKYMSDSFYINIANGIVFGLIHIPNIFVIEFKSKIISSVHIFSNVYLGYYLATIHDDLLLCIIIHIIYNFTGVTITFICSKYTAKKKVETSALLEKIGESLALFDNTIYVTKPKLRRSVSLNALDSLFVEKIDFIGIKKDKIKKDILDSIDNFNTKKNSRITKKRYVPFIHK